MPITVVCPSCNEENYGGSLYCKNCQTSLIGVPRQGEPTPSNETISHRENNPFENSNEINNAQSNSDFLISDGRTKMFAEIRSWGLWSLGFGALHIITSGFLSAPWGVLLFIVGLASFYFRSASMFVVYAITLGWAGISNIIGFEIGWIALGLYQIYLSFRVFKQFRHFQSIENAYYKLSVEDAYTQLDTPQRASTHFPWLGPLFGCSSIIGFVLFVFVIIIVAVGAESNAPFPSYFNFIEGVIFNLGILGIAISLASLLSNYRWKWLAIVGIIGGAITVLLELFGIFLP